MTHISTSITMGRVDLTQDQFPEMVERAPSPTKISSLARVMPKEKIISNPPILQDNVKEMVERNSGGKLEDTKETHNFMAKYLRERIHASKERVRLLSKFTIKVTHVVATTLHLLKDNQEEDLTHEDSRMLFNFLVEDWANILLKEKDEKKPNQGLLLSTFVFDDLLVFGLCQFKGCSAFV